MNFNNEPSPIQAISHPLLKEKNIQLFVKRDDLIHPYISGNKWRKLKYNFIEAQNQNKSTLLTFGGAYSNHIHALAYAGKAFGFNTIGIIRGERAENLSPTLVDAEKWGMRLLFVSREEYKQRHENDYIDSLHFIFGDFYHVPEGGTNDKALLGVAELVDEIGIPFDYIACACGTGGTLSGIILGLEGKKNVLGFSTLKGDFMSEEVNQLIDHKYHNFEMFDEYHFGGYAKIQAELVIFMDDFTAITQIALEPVYTGKMFFGLFDLIKKDKFASGSTIVAIHTGGMQGLRGIEEKLQKLRTNI